MTTYRLTITKPKISTRNKILIILLIGILIRILFWSSKSIVGDFESLAHLRYAEQFADFEVPKVKWIGLVNQSFSFESYPPNLYLITASIGLLAQSNFSFIFTARFVSLIFSLMILLVGAIYSLKVKNHYVIALISLLPLEWFETLQRFNNDVAVAFFTSAAFLVALREINTRNVILLSLLTSLALLSKLNGLILVLPILLYIWFSSRNLKLVLIFIAITILIAGPWYLRNFLLYGDPFFIPLDEETGKDFKGNAVNVIESLIFGLFPFCNLGIFKDIIMLAVISLLVFSIMRSLEERFKHMLSHKTFDIFAVYLLLLFIIWVLFKYVFSNASPKYLLVGILPLSVLTVSGIKSKYIFWFIYLSFAYVFMEKLLIC